MTTRKLRPLSICALATFAGLVALAPPAGAASVASPQGEWLTEDKDAALSIGDCGGQLCGRIIWMERFTDRRGAILVDDMNPDPAKHNRRICGLMVMTDLAPSASESWEGHVYNPKDGRTYRAKITMLSRDALKIRAYIGVPMFGRTQIWTRVDARVASGTEYRCPTQITDDVPAPSQGDARRAENAPR
jgi:uncharacterized protein (DUF2147 family)